VSVKPGAFSSSFDHRRRGKISLFEHPNEPLHAPRKTSFITSNFRVPLPVRASVRLFSLSKQAEVALMALASVASC
jgi:hypothetical protein